MVHRHNPSFQGQRPVLGTFFQSSVGGVGDPERSSKTLQRGLRHVDPVSGEARQIVSVRSLLPRDLVPTDVLLPLSVCEGPFGSRPKCGRSRSFLLRFYDGRPRSRPDPFSYGRSQVTPYRRLRHLPPRHRPLYLTVGGGRSGGRRVVDRVRVRPSGARVPGSSTSPCVNLVGSGFGREGPRL